MMTEYYFLNFENYLMELYSEIMVEDIFESRKMKPFSRLQLVICVCLQCGCGKRSVQHL